MVETKVADTILDNKFSYEVGGVIYEVAPPSCGTIIELSSLVSGIPLVDIDEKTDVISVILKHGKDCGNIISIAALLILGYNGKKGKRAKKVLFFNKEEEYDRYEELKERLLTISPKSLEKIIGEILAKSEIDVFFYILTSLKEANILKPTKTTAHGL